MRLFVTGASGGLGRALAEKLAARGHALTLLSRRETASSSFFHVRGDLLNPAGYEAALAGHDAVLHLAAVTHSADPDLYYAVNARGTEGLLAAARRAGVTRFIHVSTCAVGADCGAYGDSKALAEDAVRASGLAWTILRPAEVYGASDREAVGQTIAAVRQGLVVPYVAHPEAKLAPVHRDDVLEAVCAAVERPSTAGKIYVLAGPEVFTQVGMVAALREVFPGFRLPVPVPVVALKVAAGLFGLLGLRRPPFVPDQIPRLLCPKDRAIGPARRELGFAPRFLRQGVRDQGE
ncbi:MAG: NAD-dependent epimerase/dehydratase family protein [Desulfovibrio sp.]|jgi:NADH dehydrogenase|nr:NAD-dependent epimerase/dehydratase family protein [Desulfovibrio sp.]